MIDGPDPLAGKDPHPREQIDTWPLHDARQELLEEIVSQPGPAATPPARRFLLPVGIAAALAIVAGGAWVAVGGDDGGGGRDDAVVAASSDAPTASDPDTTTTATAEPTTEPTDDTEGGRQDEVRRGGVRIGKVETVRDCARLLRRLDDDEIDRLPKAVKRRKNGDLVLYLVRDRRRHLAVDGDCRVIRLSELRDRRRP